MAKAADVPSLDAFSESLRQLQALHQHQVLALIREVAQLRGELGRSKGVSSPTDIPVEDAALGWSLDEVAVMKVHEGMLAVPQAPEAPETLDLPEPFLKQEPERPRPPQALPKSRQRRVSAPGHLPAGELLEGRKAVSMQNEAPTAHKEVRWHQLKEMRNTDGRDVKGVLDLSPREVESEGPEKNAGALPPARQSQVQDAPELQEGFRLGTKDSSCKRSEWSDRSERTDRSAHQSERSTWSPKPTQSTKTFFTSRRAKLFQSYDLFRARNRSMVSQSNFRMFWSRIISTPAFDFSMGCVIALNAIAIGVESSIVRAGGESPALLSILDHVFLVIYTAELGARFGAMGHRAVWNPWVQLDLLLVICGLADVITQLSGVVTNSQLADHVDIVRTLRLARLARMIRLMVRSNTLWMLVQGLLNSLGTLVWTCIILLILLFLFSVLGLELLTEDSSASDDYNRIAKDNFGSLMRAMTTLLMGLSLDNFGEVYRPVMLEKPFTAFYFVPFFLLVPVALMNLVTALMVNFSMEQTRKDKDAEEQMMADERAEKVKILEDAFRELDANHSNRIDLPEMLNAPEELKDLIFDVADIQDARQKDLVYIFKMLDFDNSGYVDIAEFCEGLLKLNNPSALSTYATVRYCTTIASMLKEGRGRRGSTASAAEIPNAPPATWGQTIARVSGLRSS